MSLRNATLGAITQASFVAIFVCQLALQDCLWTAPAKPFTDTRCIHDKLYTDSTPQVRRSQACCLMPVCSPSPDCAWSSAEVVTRILSILIMLIQV